MSKQICFITIALVFTFQLIVGQCVNHLRSCSLFKELDSPWVDSVYQQMNSDERIAQLFWIAVEEIQHDTRFQNRLKLIEEYQPGGILFMKNQPEPIARFINASQARSKVPLLVSIDAEWGMAMRVDDVVPYPKPMTLGAVQDIELHYQLGLEITKQFHRMGIHVNFAPVADVNSNPLNPIIGTRSFGQDPVEVAKRSVACMLGMQDGGVVAVAKHFPGHGDTDVDSHHALPVINHDRLRLDSIELVPFNALVKNGVIGIMTAHIDVPELAGNDNVPASLSPHIVTDLLRNQMGFSGLIVTDAMNMQGVKQKNQPGRVDALAIIAGNDVVESTEDLPKAIVEVKNAILKGELSWDVIEQKCKKSLALKHLLQIQQHPVNILNIVADLNNTIDKTFLQKLYDNSITKVNLNDSSSNIDTAISQAVLKIGSFDPEDIFTEQGIESYRFNLTNRSEVLQKLQHYDRIVIALTQSSRSISNWNQSNFQAFYKTVCTSKKVRIVYIGSPYYFDKFPGVENATDVVFGYEKNQYTYLSLAKYINGTLLPKGKLPVTINDFLPVGAGGRQKERHK